MTQSDLPELFECESMSTTEMRQTSALLEQLKLNPFVAISMERYGSREGVVISPELWKVVNDVMTGRSRIWHVPLPPPPATDQPHPPAKLVVARELSPTEEGFQRWDVLIDWMPYSLKGGGPEVDPKAPKADYQQLIWKHHPDVARSVLRRFPWGNNKIDERAVTGAIHRKILLALYDLYEERPQAFVDPVSLARNESEHPRYRAISEALIERGFVARDSETGPEDSKLASAITLTPLGAAYVMERGWAK